MADDINSNIPEEELPEGIIELTDEDGVTTQFEYLTTIDHEGELYVVLMLLEDEESDVSQCLLSDRCSTIPPSEPGCHPASNCWGLNSHN